MAIPKIIHQTFSDWNDLDCSLQKNISDIRELNKTWDYRFYDDSDICKFITQYYNSDMLEIYEQINPGYPAARADLFRYLLMYRYGGVYLDIKSTSTLNLDEVILYQSLYLLSHWNHGWGKHPEFGVKNEFQQWHIIATPGHPYLRSVIQRVIFNIRRYDRHKDGVGTDAVLSVTGPIAYTLAIRDIKNFMSIESSILRTWASVIPSSAEVTTIKSSLKTITPDKRRPLILKRQRRYWFWSSAA